MADEIDDQDEALRNLRKEVRRLERKLVRCEEHRVRLEEIRDKNVALLERSQQEIQDRLVELRSTQAQLVQSEKLAALGELVAGVAHEINTPVGIGVTAASHLAEEAVALRALFEAGRMKRSSLGQFLDKVDEAGALLLSNLQRTADLVRSFKQVAVDQSSEAPRAFVLEAYLEDILRSLGPKLKRTPHTVEVDCPPEIELNSYPGALSQTVTNLVMNSVIHAFDEDQAGHLRIVATAANGMLDLVYSDDGRGIPPDVLPRIFEPFFTTKRGRGGSGLGLHIVHNLVTQRLSGKIRVDSEVGRGTTFSLRIPTSLVGP